MNSVQPHIPAEVHFEFFGMTIPVHWDYHAFLMVAVWFVLVGAGVLAGGWALVTGRRWGRGLAVFTQLLLLPVAWYLAVGSDRPALGIPLGLLALIALGLLFSASAVRWAAGRDQPGPASAASSEPDTR